MRHASKAPDRAKMTPPRGYNNHSDRELGEWKAVLLQRAEKCLAAAPKTLDDLPDDGMRSLFRTLTEIRNLAFYLRIIERNPVPYKGGTNYIDPHITDAMRALGGDALLETYIEVRNLYYQWREAQGERKPHKNRYHHEQLDDISPQVERLKALLDGVPDDEATAREAMTERWIDIDNILLLVRQILRFNMQSGGSSDFPLEVLDTHVGTDYSRKYSFLIYINGMVNSGKRKKEHKERKRLAKEAREAREAAKAAGGA